MKLDEQTKTVFLGIRLLYFIDTAKNLIKAELKLIQLRGLLEALEISERIKNDFADKYDGEKWYSFVHKTVAYYARHEQKYINETNNASTEVLSFPKKTLENWDQIRSSKLDKIRK